MRPAVVVAALLAVACATADARPGALLVLKAQRVEADAAFAGFYAAEARRALDATAASGGGLADYRTRLASLDALQTRVAALVRAADAAIGSAVAALAAGSQGDVVAPARAAVRALCEVVLSVGLPVAVPR